MSGENRSCSEFKSNEPGILVNCANCKRWNYSRHKCREEIWVLHWLTYQVYLE